MSNVSYVYCTHRGNYLNAGQQLEYHASGPRAGLRSLRKLQRPTASKLPATVPSLARVEWERMQRVNSLTAGCDNLTHPKMMKLMFDGRGTLSGCGPHSHRYLLLSSAFR